MIYAVLFCEVVLGQLWPITCMQHSPPGSPKGPNWRNEKSSKKGADENEPYAINIEKIVIKIVLLDYKFIGLVDYHLKF